VERDLEKAGTGELSKPRVGDIVLIPTGKEYVPAQILYLSRVFRHTALIGVYNVTLQEVEMPQELPDSFGLQHIYTSVAAIKKGTWPTVGYKRLEENQKGLSECIVGGQVWLEDKVLRHATPEDYQRLPQMMSAGFKAVEIEIRSMLTKVH